MTENQLHVNFPTQRRAKHFACGTTIVSENIISAANKQRTPQINPTIEKSIRPKSQQRFKVQNLTPKHQLNPFEIDEKRVQSSS